MSMSIYIEFKRELDTEELSSWAGVHLTDYDVVRAGHLNRLWAEFSYIYYASVTALIDKLPFSTQKKIVKNALRQSLRHEYNEDDFNKFFGTVWIAFSMEIRDKMSFHKGEYFFDPTGYLWDACRQQSFLYNHFGLEGWKIATLRSHPYRQWIWETQPRELFEDREYIASGGSLDHSESMQFCWNHVKELNGNGIFPIEVVDHIYWG